MKKTVILMGILGLMASASFAQWRLDQGSGLLATNLDLSGASFRGKTAISSAEKSLLSAAEDQSPSPPTALAEAVAPGSTVTTNETTITPEIRALADALGNDPLKILDYVRDHIQYIPRAGVYTDARGCLLAGRGSDWDMAVLMTALLRASGYTTRYVKGLVLYDDYDLLNQFDMDTYDAWASMAWERDLVSYYWDDYSTLFLRVWVECWVNGAWQALDPTFKEYESHDPADIKAAMQYNFSTFMNSALTGASSTADYVKNLNEANIRAALNTYRTNLNAYFKTGTVYTATYEALGTRTIVPQESTDYPGTVPPYGWGVFGTYLDSWDNFPTNYHAKVSVQHAGINISLKAWEVAGRRLSILYDSTAGNRPYLSLDGKEIARGNTTTAGATNALILSAIWPVFVDGSAANVAYVTNTVTMGLKSGTSYVLVHDFENTSEKVQKAHGNQFSWDRQLKPVGSEAVTAGALQLVADSYLNQHNQYQQLVGAVLACAKNDRCFFGVIASATNGYFVDLPGAVGWCSSKIDNALQRDAAYSLGAFVSSSLEHGVLEQNQGTNNPAVSTIKLLQLCNQSNSNQIFYVHSNNWNSIQGQLLNYSAADKTAIANQISSGSVGYIPKNASITLSKWTGIGYAMEGPASVLMAIAGGYHGGYNASGSSFSVPAVVQNQGLTAINNNVVNVAYTYSKEPVNLTTGDYIVDHTDLTLGGAAPLGLNFSRYYNSANRAVRGVLGNGWEHNLDIRAFEISQGAEMLDGDRALDVVSALVQLTVAKDLMTNAYDSVKRPISMLVTKWGMDQLINSRVLLQFGSRNLIYTRTEDGSYVPPPGETATLRKDNGRFVLQERFGTSYTFNTNGFLDTWRDADSNTLAFAYSNGRLQTATDAFGRTLSLTYNATNLLTQVADSTGRAVTFAYSPTGNLTNYTDAASCKWGYDYNTNNLLTVARDPDGVVTIRNYYDPLGCVTQQVSATSNIWRFTIGGNMGIEKDPFGKKTVHEFDDDGRNLGTENASGVRTYVGYDIEGLVSYGSDLNDNWTLYIHDNQFNLTHTLEAFFSDVPRETFFGYDGLNHLVAITNALGDVTHNQYDAEHHLTSTIDVLGNETTFEYWPNGLLKKKTEAGGRTTDYTYDSYGNPDTITSTDAGIVDLDYNARGELIKQKDAKNAETLFTYDNRGLLLKTTYPDGSSVSNSYNGSGLLITQRDARSNTVTTTYTPAYKVKTITFPNGGVISNTYDAADRLVAVKNAKNQTTSYALDAVGRVTSVSSAYSVVKNDYDPIGNVTNAVVNPSGLALWTKTVYDAFNRPLFVSSALSVVENSYDLLGRQTSRIDAASKSWGSEYDALGRKTAAVRPSGATEQFVYDALGNRIGFYNAEGKPITFGFNAQGRVTAITNAIGKVTRFVYDVNGNMTSRTDAKNAETVYSYNSMNRLTNVVHESVSKASFAYDANGNIVSQASPLALSSFAYDSMNRLSSSLIIVNSRSFAVTNSYDLNGNRTNIIYPGGLSVCYTYDAENRLSGVAVSAPSEPLREFSFAYDGASRLTSMSYPNGVNATFGYDAESKVVSYNHGAFLNHSITRDPRGFKTQEDISAGLVPNFTNGLRQTRTHNDADQLLSAGTNEYSYDPNGNLTNSVWGTYEWDYNNRLDATPGVQYLYDASGVRIGRIAGVSPAVTNYFVVDSADPLKRPLAETDSTGNVTRYYVWAGFRLLAHIEANGTVQYYHGDELGSTLALTDGAGAVTDQFAYSPYGQLLSRTGTNSTAFLWLGGYGVYYDSAANLHLTLHRAYSAEQKRFISCDPLGIDGGMNLYAYGNLNPLAFVDPKGLYNQAVDYWANMAVNTDNSVVRSGALTMGAIAGTYPDVITLDGRVAGAIGLGGEGGKGVVINLNDFTVAPYTTKGFAVGYQKVSPSLTTGLGWNINQSAPANSDFQGPFHEVSASAAGKTGGAYWDSNWRGVSFGVTTKGAGATYQYVYYDVGDNVGQSSISQPNTSQSFSKPLK